MILRRHEDNLVGNLLSRLPTNCSGDQHICNNGEVEPVILDGCDREDNNPILLRHVSNLWPLHLLIEKLPIHDLHVPKQQISIKYVVTLQQ